MSFPSPLAVLTLPDSSMNTKENNDRNQTVYFGMIYVPNGLVTWSRLKKYLYTESQIRPSGYQGNLQLEKVAVLPANGVPGWSVSLFV